MPKVLTRVKLSECSLVDKGAGEGVTVKLIKKDKPLPFKGAKKPFGGDTEDQEEDKAKSSKRPNLKDNDEMMGSKVEDDDGYDGNDDADMTKGWVPYWKREWTTEQRRAAVHNGQAMPGGGYPIANREDLENAVQAIGRAKKPNKTKEHIMSRARALGCTDCIPDKWLKKSTTKAVAKAAALVVEIFKDGQDEATSFNEVMSDIHDSGSIEKLEDDVHSAMHALKDSLASINGDSSVGDKMSAARESMQEFVDHVTALVPSDVAKAWKERAMRKTAHTSVGMNDKDSRQSEIKDKGKIVDIESEDEEGKDVNQADNKEIGATAGSNDRASAKSKMWKGRFDSVLSMEPDHVEYLRHPDNLMDRSEVHAFVDMGKADRVKWIEKNPIGEMTTKRMAGLPEPLRKQLEAGAKAAETLAKREEAELTASIAKRASDVRLGGEGVTEALVKLHKADGEAFDLVMKAVETMAKAHASQERTSLIFKEFGNSQANDGATGGGSAHAQLMEKAAAHKADVEKNGGKITHDQAYAHVITKRENAQLFALAKREGVAAVAA